MKAKKEEHKYVHGSTGKHRNLCKQERLRRAAGFRNVRRSAVILRKRGVLAWRQNDEALRGVGSEGFAGGGRGGAPLGARCQLAVHHALEHHGEQHEAHAANPSLAELEDELFPLPAEEEDHYAQAQSLQAQSTQALPTQADPAQSHLSEIGSSQADSSHADSSVFVSGGFLPGSGNG